MVLTLPDHIPALQRKSEQKIRRGLALAFYAECKITIVQAADLEQTNLFDFQKLLRDRRIRSIPCSTW